MSLFRSSKKNNTLLLDISSSSVAAALVHNEEGKAPEIDYFVRIPFNNEENELQSIEFKLIQTLKLVLQESYKTGISTLQKKGRATSIERVLIGLSSIWYASSLVTKSLSDKEGIFLTITAQRDFLLKEEGVFKEELKNLYKDDSEIFESNIISVAANGYPMDDWTNRTAVSFDITYLLAGAPKKLITEIENEIINTFGVKNGLSVHSINFVLSKLIASSFKNVHSALLVDLSAETTDLLFIHNHAPIKHTRLAFGTSSLLRNISENFNVPIQIAESSLALYAKKLLREEDLIDIDKVFSEAEEEWALYDALSSADLKVGSPQNIFIVSDTPYANIGKAIVEDIFPEKKVAILDCQSGFLQACIGKPEDRQVDGHLAVLGAYSQFFS